MYMLAHNSRRTHTACPVVGVVEYVQEKILGDKKGTRLYASIVHASHYWVHKESDNNNGLALGNESSSLTQDNQ